jgi:hypothetical protein
MQASTADAARQEIGALAAQHRAGALGLNEAGIDAIAREFTPSIVRANLLSRWEEIILARRTVQKRDLRKRDTSRHAEQASR